MKQTTRLLCLILAAVMTFGLCACPATEPSTGTTAASGTSGTTAGTPGGNTPPEAVDAIYANGGEIDGAGASLAEGAFALTAHTPDGANAIEIETLSSLFRNRGPEANATYRLTATAPVILAASGKVYNGNGAIILAPCGVVINGAYDFALTNITIIGPVTFVGARLAAFSQVEIVNEGGTAVGIAADCENVTLTDCRIVGKIGVDNAGSATTVSACYISASEYGVKDAAARDTAVAGCEITGAAVGIESSSDYAQLRENTLTLAQGAVGISLTAGAEHALIALNKITGAQKSVVITGALNSSVILNSAVTVHAEKNTSLYICDNALGGRLRLAENNYLLADGNTYPEDGLDHTPLQSGNQNTNGDDITDITARPEAGANEDLLPHVNKDLFLGAERHSTVRVGGADTGLAINKYIMTEAAKKDVSRIIIAPGVYTATDRTDLRGGNGQSGVTVYGYGVMMERLETASTQSGGACGNQFNIIDMEGFTLKGMTLSYERQSVGQAYVLAKLGGGKLLIVTGAGFVNEFGNSDNKYYSGTYMAPQRAGAFYPYCDSSFKTVTHRSDGLMEMTVSDSVYQMTLVGDVLTCENSGSPTLYITNSTDVVWRDVTVYGAAGVFGAMEYYNRTATTYYRVAVTTKSAPVIDEETYNRYLALSDEYGVDFEITVDSEGRLRGSLPRIGADDATHTTSCAQGAVAKFCIFENMSDDATNQNHQHARLHAVTDNGDGTTTVTYKGNYSSISYDRYNYGGGSYCRNFSVGDRVFIYTAAGRLVADTPALSATVNTKKTVLNEQMYNRAKAGGKTVTEAECSTVLYEITVATEAIDREALVGYNLANNDCENTHKVLIDNMSMASNGFYFDNCLIQNIRSRGLLIKASDGKILNCTFRNIGMSCAAVLYEIEWGESGVSENLEIAQNVMDNTGFFKNIDYYSPISIRGLGSRVEEEYLLYKNIVIRDNVMANRRTNYAIYINSACDVKVTGNNFGTCPGGDSEEKYSLAVHIWGAMNIEISDNTYSPLGLPITELIKAARNKNIFGTDVTFDGVSVIPDSN